MSRPTFSSGAKTARPRAYYHARFAVAHAPPLPRALSIRQATMQNRHAFAKSRAAEARGPERGADLRHQHQRRTAARERGLHRVQIDFGLTAAGDSVKQSGDEFSRVEPNCDFLHGAPLLFVEHIWRRA